MRRFLQHVLPKGFVKIRHYGLLANRRRAARLEQCRRLLLVENAVALLTTGGEVAVEPTLPHCCVKCGGTRLIYRELKPGESPGSHAMMAQDSS